MRLVPLSLRLLALALWLRGWRPSLRTLCRLRVPGIRLPNARLNGMLNTRWSNFRGWRALATGRAVTRLH